MAGKGSALKEALEKWKKDQARNQTLQTQVADEKAKRTTKNSKARSSTKNAKATGSAANSSGPEDLKAQLRTLTPTKASAVPLSKQLKATHLQSAEARADGGFSEEVSPHGPEDLQDSLDALQRAQESLTPAELQQTTGHDCGPGTALADHLAKNPKIELRGGRLRFRAAAEVKVRDRTGALKFIQSSKGCMVKDLVAAYPEAEEDVKHLRSEDVVWILPAAEKDQQAVFPREKPPMITVSEEVLKLWHSIEVPDDPEEQARELKKANIASAVQRGKRERPKKDKKEKKKRAVNFDRFKRITNEHLPELFVGEAATSID